MLVSAKMVWKRAHRVWSGKGAVFPAEFLNICLKMAHHKTW